MMNGEPEHADADGTTTTLYANHWAIPPIPPTLLVDRGVEAARWCWLAGVGHYFVSHGGDVSQL